MTWITSRTSQHTHTVSQKKNIWWNAICVSSITDPIIHRCCWQYSSEMYNLNFEMHSERKNRVCACACLWVCKWVYGLLPSISSNVTTHIHQLFMLWIQKKGVHALNTFWLVITDARIPITAAFEWIFNFAICIINFHALPQNENGATVNRGRCFNLVFGSFCSADWLVG